MAEERQCMCTTPEITIKLNKQGPQGKVGPQGEPGFSPYIGVANDTPSQYILKITNEEGEYLTPNLKANIPLGGGTGDVLTKNSNVDGDCSFKALPYATTGQQGVVYLATTEEALLGDPDYAITGEVLLGVLANKVGNGTITLTQGGVTKGTFTTNQAGDTTISLDSTPTNMVTTDTSQTISGMKTFSNGLRTLTLRDTSGSAYMTFNPSALGSQLGFYSDNTTFFGNFTVAGTALISRDGSSYSVVDAGNISNYIGNGTITFTQDGVTKGTITTNQSGDTTIALDAGGASYTAGNGIDITNDEISVDDTVVALQSDIPDISNMVTTNTAQTITGDKTTANIILGSNKKLQYSDGYNVLNAFSVNGMGGLVFGNNTAPTDIYSSGAIIIYRNSNRYTNIDSGNIGTYAVTTDTAQTISGTKTFNNVSVSNMLSLTRNSGAVLQLGTSVVLDNQTRYKNITAPMADSTAGATSGGAVLSVKTSGDGISSFSTELSVGDNTHASLILKSLSDINIIRGSNTYTNLDSGNISTNAYIQALEARITALETNINGGSANA